MVRIITIAYCALFLGLTSVYSQSTGVGWGIKGGLNMSGAQTDNILLVKNDPKLGWQAGLFTKSIVDGWGYLIEATINALGSKQQFGDESQKNSLGYLSFPLAVQYRTANKIDFYLGGYAGFRMWARRTSSKPGFGDIESNIKDNIAFFDYGVLAGISYTYQRFLVDLRYQQGIQNINTNAQINVRANNASGQLSIGYYLK